MKEPGDVGLELLKFAEVKGRRYTEAEKKRLKKLLPRNTWLVKYCIWKQVRTNGRYILFVIDAMPYRTRPTAVDNALEVICTRPLCDKEYEEQIENFGCSSRILETYSYVDVDYLIYEDKKYGIETPQKFVNECRKRGYTKQPDLFGTTWEV